MEIIEHAMILHPTIDLICIFLFVPTLSHALVYNTPTRAFHSADVFHDSYAFKASAIALFTAKRKTCSSEKEVRSKEGPQVYAEREVAIVVLAIYASVTTLILISPYARRKWIPGPWITFAKRERFESRYEQRSVAEISKLLSQEKRLSISPEPRLTWNLLTPFSQHISAHAHLLGFFSP